MSPPSATLIAGPVVAGTIVLVLSATTLFVVYRRRKGRLPDVTHDIHTSRVPQLNVIEPIPQTHARPLTNDTSGPYPIPNTRNVTESLLIDEDHIAEVAGQNALDIEARWEEGGAPRPSSEDVDPGVDLDVRDRRRTESKTFDVDLLMEIVRERMENDDPEQPQGATRLESEVSHPANTHQNEHR